MNISGADRRAATPDPERLVALDRPRDPRLRHRRPALQGPRRLPPPARRALRRRLLRAGDQHPRRRAGGRRPDARRRVPARTSRSSSTSRPGRRFDFGVTRIVNAPPPRRRQARRGRDPGSIGFRPGEPALSGVVNQASALSVERWRQLARAKAREAEREVIADHGTSELDVTLTMDPGRAATYGPIQVVGSQRVDPDFIAFMADLPEGAPFDPDDIDAGQPRLTQPRHLPLAPLRGGRGDRPDGSLPITVRVEDRRPRTIGAGATLSTIDGLGVAAFWVNRNLFGRAEQLRFDAGIDGLGGSLDPNDYDYNLGVTFTQPGVCDPDTNFVTSLVASASTSTPTASVRSPAPPASRQLFGEQPDRQPLRQISRARYEDDFGIRHFTIFALVGAAQYDRRDDPLDATRGYYVAASAEPFYEAEFGNVGLQTTLEGRVYRGFGERAPHRARRPRQGRQLPRPRRRGEPARPAVLRRRRRLGARLPLPLDRRRELRDRRRRDLRGRRRRPARGLGRVALPHQRTLRRASASSTPASSPRARASRREPTFKTGAGSGCATSPPSACSASTWPRRSSRIRTIRPWPSTSASDRRFEAARGNPVAFVLVAITALAQDVSQEGDNGFLLNLLETRLSAPGRQIRLSGVSGALSSQARIQRVTISDARGAWLEIDNVELDWSRLALLRGRVAVNRLSASRIAWLRRAEIPPQPAAACRQAEAKPFQLPAAARVDPGRATAVRQRQLRSERLRAGRRPLRGWLARPGRRRARHQPRHPAPRRPGRQPDPPGRLLERDPAARHRPRPAGAPGRASWRRCSGSRARRRST